MPFDAFDNSSLPVNVAVLVVAAVLLWPAGARLATNAEVLAERTGLGNTFAGLVLLAGATSLPELAIVVTGASIGNPDLILNDLFGGIALQVTLLAFIDAAVLGSVALTFFTPRSELILQGIGLIFLLALAQLALLSGEIVSLGHVGLWPLLLLLAYLGFTYLSRVHQPGWRPVDVPDAMRRGSRDRGKANATGELKGAALGFAAASVVILITGVLVTLSGDRIAEQSGLGSSFTGVTLLAAASSLPEISTTFTAAKSGAYAMAVANIQGSNAILVALVFVAEIAYTDGLIVNAASSSTVVAATLGILLTASYLAGLTERRDAVFLRMGVDSLAVVVLYVVGVAVLFSLR